MPAPLVQHYLLASDFDQTLSFNDSGQELARLLGVQGFEGKVTGLALQEWERARTDRVTLAEAAAGASS